MVMEKRRRAILSILVDDGHVRVTDLAERFGVSDDTIRRDLTVLSGEGYLQKTHGGAVNLDIPSMRRDLRSGIALAAKELIGQKAIAHLTVGDTIFLDAGQTVLEVAKRLPAGNFTVITPSLDVASALSIRADIRLIILGGEWDSAQRLFRGPTTIEAIKTFRANMLVTGACAVDRILGVTASEEWDAAAKRAMFAVSEHKMLVADNTKMGRREPFFVSPLEDYDFFITDQAAGEGYDSQECGGNEVAFSHKINQVEMEQ